MKKIKEHILEHFEGVDFLPGKDKQLVGYAEMFGVECMPLYKGINYIPYRSSKEAVKKILEINPKARSIDKFNGCITGHLKLKSGKTILLYSRTRIINKLIREYSKDKTGLFKDYEEVEEGAWDWYDYNMIGTYMAGVPAFAVLYSK